MDSLPKIRAQQAFIDQIEMTKQMNEGFKQKITLANINIKLFGICEQKSPDCLTQINTLLNQRIAILENIERIDKSIEERTVRDITPDMVTSGQVQVIQDKLFERYQRKAHADMLLFGELGLEYEQLARNPKANFKAIVTLIEEITEV